MMGRPMRDNLLLRDLLGLSLRRRHVPAVRPRLRSEDMEGDADMATDNIATQLLAKMLDLEPPT